MTRRLVRFKNPETNDQLIPDIKIGEVSDINVSSANDGDIMMYDSANNRWVNNNNKNVVFRKWAK